MNTFLPYRSFSRSARCLDWRRLGKQRLEARQILRALRRGGGWRNHVLMWKGYEPALSRYMNACIREWRRRGYRTNMPLARTGGKPRMPPWLGSRAFHSAMRSNLTTPSSAGTSPPPCGRNPLDLLHNDDRLSV